MIKAFIPQKKYGAWNSAEERKAYFDRLEEETPKCNCGIERQPDYEESRARHGVETHSPYCPVGKAERTAI